MCLCTPINLRWAYCGKKYRLPDNEVGLCAHPRWLDKAGDYPSTVDEATGKWTAQHALEATPKVPQPPHPGIVSRAYGFDFSQLKKLEDDLQKGVDGSKEPIQIPFTLDKLANISDLQNGPSAASINNRRQDSSHHYAANTHRIDGARRCLQSVIDAISDGELPNKGKLKQLVFLVQHAHKTLNEAYEAMIHPPAGAHGLHPAASPVPKNEPV